MPTVSVQVSAFTGDTGLSLWLYNATTGTLLNSGGDALTETGTTGYFTANVAETLGSNDYTVAVRKSGVAVFEGVLHSGRTTVGLGPVSSSGPGGATADAIEVVAGTTTLRAIVAFPGSDGGAVEPSESPGNDDWTLEINGTEQTYNVGYNLSLSTWGPCGQLLTVTLTTGLSANDAVALCGAFTVGGQSQMFNARWVATGAATETNATANRQTILAAVEGVIDHGDGTGEWGATNLGSGSTPWTEVIRTTDGTPIVGASVWITSDLAGTNVVAGTIVTISGGAFPSPFMLDSGETYYLWVSATGYNFTNPTPFTVP